MSEWPEEHSTALKDCLARGMSRARAAAIINEKFLTTYTRNAVIGRATRMEYVGPEKPPTEPKEARPKRSSRSHGPIVQSINRKRNAAASAPREPIEVVKLRCVEIVPRHLSIADLEPGNCRFPYGGDAIDEPITFCGHGPRYEILSYDRISGEPITKLSAYCEAHHFLCVGQGTISERAATRGIAG